ncbi:hypothetical protein LOC50_03550 [Pseudoalteromonas sp. SCSIO 43095]|uniref:hypothetical protein n=1 Tax=Pseudoalteromonas sp. SCSIO 43095 TaxID=2894202 RepID=UPI00202B61FB|nr:hypothetical protein [Pseudoalteromonas sp. SCSIO 43095]URQ99405.1 hypothetical protein LOC50_03550 [Pseudoalteromonas sp. SCSIO 43095]
MVNGTADFSKIQQQAQRKASLYNDVLEKFKVAQAKADAHFFKLVASTKERSDQALTLMLVVSIVLLILWLLASDTANNLSLLANGKGSLSTNLRVNSEDEIGQVSIKFNSFMALLKNCT